MLAEEGGGGRAFIQRRQSVGISGSIHEFPVVVQHSKQFNWRSTQENVGEEGREEGQSKEGPEESVEDKTFGMKNKNKSKKVQQYISTVKTQTTQSLAGDKIHPLPMATSMRCNDPND